MTDDHPKRRRSDSPLYRWMPLVGYITLTIAIGYAIWETDRLHDRDLRAANREAVEHLESTKRAVFIGCQQRNDTKVAIVGILKEFRSLAEKNPDEATVLPEDYDKAIAMLRPDDCNALAETVSGP